MFHLEEEGFAVTATRTWTPLEGSLEEILRRYPRPLEALVAGEVPAIILRRAEEARFIGCIEVARELHSRAMAEARAYLHAILNWNGMKMRNATSREGKRP